MDMPNQRNLNISSLALDLQRRLVTYAGEDTNCTEQKHWREWYAKDGTQSLGLQNPQIEDIVDSWVNDNELESKNSTILTGKGLIHELFKSRIHDEQYACIYYIHKYQQTRGNFPFTRLDELEHIFEEDHVRTSSISDMLGNRFLRRTMHVHGVEAVEKISLWSSCQNVYKGRAVVTAFTVLPKCLNALDAASLVWYVCHNMVVRPQKLMKIRIKKLLVSRISHEAKQFLRAHMAFIPKDVMKDITRFLHKEGVFSKIECNDFCGPEIGKHLYEL